MYYENNSTPTLDLHQFVSQRRRPMIWTFSCVMLLTIAVTFLGQRTYTSEAKLFVRLGRESVSLDPTATTGQVVMVNETRENEINSVFELLKSRTILINVVKAVGPQVVLGREPGQENVQTAGMFQALSLTPSYGPDDEAIKRLALGLKVAAVKKSNIINISYEAQSPELARDIVRTVIEQARETHARVNRIQGSHAFFASQAGQIRDKLDGLESNLISLKNSTGISSLEDQRMLQLQRISELQNTLATNEASLVASTAEMQAHKASLDTIPEMITKGETRGMPHSTFAAMREQLFTVQVRENELMAKFSKTHALVVLIHEQVAALQAILDREPVEPQVERGLNSVRQDIHLSFLKAESSVASLRAQTAALREQLSNAKQELTRLNNHEAELAKLEREVKLEAENYKKYSENLEQARIDHELDLKNISNLNILQPPTYSLVPSRPRRLLNLALGLIAAIGASLGVGLFIEQRQSRWLSRLLWSSGEPGREFFERSANGSSTNGQSDHSAIPLASDSSNGQDRAGWHMGPQG